MQNQHFFLEKITQNHNNNQQSPKIKFTIKQINFHKQCGEGETSRLTKNSSVGTGNGVGGGVGDVMGDGVGDGIGAAWVTAQERERMEMGAKRDKAKREYGGREHGKQRERMEGECRK